MTIQRKFNTGEGSGARGVCEPPQQGLRWTQGLTVPVECFTVRVDVHQSAQRGVYCYAFEVFDPHTRERLAQVVEPSRPYSAVLPLASSVTVDLRGVLLALTDPEPF